MISLSNDVGESVLDVLVLRDFSDLFCKNGVPPCHEVVVAVLLIGEQCAGVGCRRLIHREGTEGVSCRSFFVVDFSVSRSRSRSLSPPNSLSLSLFLFHSPNARGQDNSRTIDCPRATTLLLNFADGSLWACSGTMVDINRFDITL